MLDDIVEKSRSLPRVFDFFNGKKMPEDFIPPSDVLLYCHDYSWSSTIVSSRYMLTIPLVDLTYEIEGVRYFVHCGKAVLVKPFLHRSVPAVDVGQYLRLIVSFELAREPDYLPRSLIMTLSDHAWELVSQLLDHYLKDEVVAASLTLVLLLSELSGSPVCAEVQEHSHAVSAATSYINQYLVNTFSVKDVAEVAGLSVSHLRRRFREETGISIGEYIERRRIAAAQRLLSDTNLKVEQIASDCGYDSIYSFSRFFKRKTGISPLAFRKHCRGTARME